MATKFLPVGYDLTTALAVAYTCPANTTALVLMAQIANNDGQNDVDTTGEWLDASNANKATRLAKVQTVPPGAAVNMIAKLLILEPGDAIRFVASANNAAQATLSILEIT